MRTRSTLKHDVAVLAIRDIMKQTNGGGSSSCCVRQRYEDTYILYITIFFCSPYDDDEPVDSSMRVKSQNKSKEAFLIHQQPHAQTRTKHTLVRCFEVSESGSFDGAMLPVFPRSPLFCFLSSETASPSEAGPNYSIPSFSFAFPPPPSMRGGILSFVPESRGGSYLTYESGPHGFVGLFTFFKPTLPLSARLFFLFVYN